MNVEIQFMVNGKQRRVTTDQQRTLLELLREDIGLTGTKYGCGEGQCRACTVLLDGKPISSCLTPVSLVKDKHVQTIEGLADGDTLHFAQQAFLDAGAMQCGYCVPGMIMTTVGLLRNNPNPSGEEIVEGMNGNLCRCGGYLNILKAVQLAAKTGKEVSG